MLVGMVATAGSEGQEGVTGEVMKPTSAEVGERLAAAEAFEEQVAAPRKKRSVMRRKFPEDRAGLAEWWRKVLRQQGIGAEVLAGVLAEGLRAERPFFTPEGQIVWGADHAVRLQYYREAAKALGVYPDTGSDQRGNAIAGGVVVRLTPGLQGDVVDEDGNLESGDGDGDRSGVEAYIAVRGELYGGGGDEE